MDDPFQPLSNQELDQLDNFLLDRIADDADTSGMDEGILDISELDGFLTAIVSGPAMIMPSSWMQQVWGDFEPVWNSEQDVQTIMPLIIRQMNDIASTLMEHPEDFEPFFMQGEVDGKIYFIADEWCEGYMRGVMLAADEWELDSLEMKTLLTPIKAFAGEQAVLSDDQYNQQEIENLQDAISPNARKIHAYWLSRRTEPAPSATVKHKQARVGRNDPCPCGSGKKFKKCCLH